MLSVKFLLILIQVGLMTRISGAVPWFIISLSKTLFSWRATLSQIVALSTTEAELMALASCCCEVVWARKLAVELGFPSLPISTKTTPVVLPWQTTCIYVGATSMLPFVCASFSNPFKTESSTLNNALLHCK